MQNESAKIRLFICVELPDTAKRSIAALQAALRKSPGNLSWTRNENIHLTLKFLGDTKQRKIEKLCAVLNAVAIETKAGDILFDKTGAFPNLHKPRVLWLGCSQVCETISGLARKIDARVAEMGFQQENRPYQPHLTLARVRSGDVSAVVEKMREFRLPPIIVPVNSFTLMKSQLTQAGAIYTRLAKFTVQTKTVGEE